MLANPVVWPDEDELIMILLACTVLLPLAVYGLQNTTNNTSWPNGPFNTTGRWIIDASGANVSYAGVNWPGAGDVMIPEGLQYQSVASIVGKIKTLGMNAVRLTFATQMIDDIYGRNGTDVSLSEAFSHAFGNDSGRAVLDKVLANNPSFKPETTRLQIFDAVAAECERQQIYVHLDNHLSQAGWCCVPWDGNSWWNDIYFSVDNWTRGLSYMANHGKAWKSLTSMSLRNEPRQPALNDTLWHDSYNWHDWYRFMQQGAKAVNDANPDVLVFLAGIDSGTNLTGVVQGESMGFKTDGGNATFTPAEFLPGGVGTNNTNKIVLELHAYNMTGLLDSCNEVRDLLWTSGLSALNSPAPLAQMPVMVTEFGGPQDAFNATDMLPCLAKYLPEMHVGWFLWVMGGGYYMREGKADSDEPWGLLTHDWADWRAPDYVNQVLKPMVSATYDFSSRTAGNGGAGNGTASGQITSRGALAKHSRI